MVKVYFTNIWNIVTIFIYLNCLFNPLSLNKKNITQMRFCLDLLKCQGTSIRFKKKKSRLCPFGKVKSDPNYPTLLYLCFNHKTLYWCFNHKTLYWCFNHTKHSTGVFLPKDKDTMGTTNKYKKISAQMDKFYKWEIPGPNSSCVEQGLEQYWL